MASTPPPGWYPDPSATAALRWWDGTAWTGHVHQGGPPPAAAVPDQGVLWTSTRLTYAESRHDNAVGGPLDLLDDGGAVVGTVRSMDGSPLPSERYAVAMEVADAAGTVALRHVEPPHPRPSGIVLAPTGAEWGRLVPSNAWREDQFDLVVGGRPLAEAVAVGNGRRRYEVVDKEGRGLRATLVRESNGPYQDRWALERDPTVARELVPLLLALPIQLDAIVDEHQRDRRRRFR